MSRRTKFNRDFPEFLKVVLTFLGNKELNQVADTLVSDSENKLLRKRFMFWKEHTKHSQVARYHHERKTLQRYEISGIASSTQFYASSFHFCFIMKSLR